MINYVSLPEGILIVWMVSKCQLFHALSLLLLRSSSAAPSLHVESFWVSILSASMMRWFTHISSSHNSHVISKNVTLFFSNESIAIAFIPNIPSLKHFAHECESCSETYEGDHHRIHHIKLAVKFDQKHPETPPLCGAALAPQKYIIQEIPQEFPGNSTENSENQKLSLSI